MDMHEVARIVWRDCLGAKRGERALIITDPSGERLEIAETLRRACAEFCGCELVKMGSTGMNGREPEPAIADMMLEHDIVVAPTEYSITHTRAVAALKAVKGRVATMPGITRQVFLRAIPVNYSEMAETNSRLRELIAASSAVRVTTAAGTDMAMEVEKGRRVCNGDGILVPGKVKNLPDGEVSFAPKEGSADGVAVFDLSSLGGRLARPFRAAVKGGFLEECGSSGLWKILSGVENGTNFAELGIGTNPRASITGIILEDEKVKGTAHMAFGTNTSLHGRVQTSVHLDSVLGRPTIELDGKVIIKEGKFLF